MVWPYGQTLLYLTKSMGLGVMRSGLLSQYATNKLFNLVQDT